MTITATQFPALPAPSTAAALTGDEAHGADVDWRALSAGMWVARRDGRHLGAVQRGRRWLASDADSEPIGAFRTFSEAQAAVMSPDSCPVQARGTVRSSPALVVAASVLAALASAAVWVCTGLLV